MEQYTLRLNNLRDTDMISSTVYEKLFNLISELKKDDLLRDTETVNMMITHIALALQRVENGEDIQKMTDDVLEEIHNHPYFAQAFSLYQKNLPILGELSENEKPYLLANFIILFR